MPHSRTLRTPALLLVLVWFVAGAVQGQTPAGAIAGVVSDRTGALLTDVRILIVNRHTGHSRTVDTSAEGVYVATGLAPGLYRVTVQAAAFKPLDRDVGVEAGTTTTVDVSLELGEISERVTVAATVPLIRRSEHQVGGVVSRAQIESLPLNGRNFLELARLEPGVSNTTRLVDGRTFVSSLGGGLQTIPRIGATRVTIDGGNVTTPGTAGVLLQVSQDVVQEFQMATVNFDPGAGLTSNGAINIVTRSGTNTFQGSGFYFYRDHRLAAYPGLTRDPRNPDPSFERRQFGSYAGGPLRRDRAFFFASFERTNQVGVVSVQPLGRLAALGGIFQTPYTGNQISLRGDVRLHRNHSAFARYTYDRNSTFANLGPQGLPSSWSTRTNQTEQRLAALTSVLSPRLVNDLRFSHFPTTTAVTSATADDCPNCFGLGAVRTIVENTGVIFGSNTGSILSSGARYQLTDSLSWQHGSHGLRFGFDWEHSTASAVFTYPNLGEITLFSPDNVHDVAPHLPVPSAFTTSQDIWQLPFRQLAMTVGGGPMLWSDFREHRVADFYRLYFADTWRARSRLTLNLGVGWSYEPNALNHDLTKPALLAPILGAGGLRPPAPQTGSVSPTLGFVWTATADGRTVVRGGAGRYFDPAGSTNAVNLGIERGLLSPLGTGSLERSGANIVHDGRPLMFLQPTSLTGAQVVALLPAIEADLLRSINPGNQDFAVRNINRTKEGRNIYDPDYATPYAVHASMGVQRELAGGLVMSADVAWKRFLHTYINGIDYNRWFGTRGPVVPRCATEAEKNDVHAGCSNGPMYFDTTSGRARYLGLLLRLEKRLSHRTQFLGSYALGSFVGSNGTGTGTSEAAGGRWFGFNNDNWLENDGPLPTDLRHILHVSGVVELPWRLQIAVAVSAASAPPVAPYVGGMDFNGDGTVNDLLPGTTVNQFGRDLGRDDLARLIDDYNQQYADRLTAGGQRAPRLVLPEDYSFSDSLFTQDLRLTRTFSPGVLRVYLHAPRGATLGSLQPGESRESERVGRRTGAARRRGGRAAAGLRVRCARPVRGRAAVVALAGTDPTIHGQSCPRCGSSSRRRWSS